MTNIKRIFKKTLVSTFILTVVLFNNSKSIVKANNLNLSDIRRKAAEQYGEEFAKTLYLEWNSELGKYDLVIKKDIGNKPITRAAFANLIMDSYKKNKGDIKVDNMSKFHDTSDPNIYKALKVGIIKGKSETMFDPNGYIIREEIAMMIDRYVTSLNLPILPEGNRVTFADQGQISNWANPSIQRLYHLGILNGVGGGRINPKGLTKTKDAETLLNRVDKKIIKNK